MNLWERFKLAIGLETSTADQPSVHPISQANQDDAFLQGYQPMPLYVDAFDEEAQTVALIASAIAAGNKSSSKWRVHQVQKVNPDLINVAVIATSLAALDYPKSQFVVRRIYKKQGG